MRSEPYRAHHAFPGRRAVAHCLCSTGYLRKDEYCYLLTADERAFLRGRVVLRYVRPLDDLADHPAHGLAKRR